MAKLAIHGGKAIRAKGGTWAKWPVSDEADAKLMAEVTRSNNWSYDGKYEWEFSKLFTEYQKGKFGLCAANGTVGIQMALEVQKGRLHQLQLCVRDVVNFQHGSEFGSLAARSGYYWRSQGIY